MRPEATLNPETDGSAMDGAALLPHSTFPTAVSTFPTALATFPAAVARLDTSSTGPGHAARLGRAVTLTGKSYTCNHCQREYASTDAARKHARQNHPEWLREQGQGSTSLYCTAIERVVKM